MCQFCGKYIVLTTDGKYWCPNCCKYQIWTEEEITEGIKKAKEFDERIRWA